MKKKKSRLVYSGTMLDHLDALKENKLYQNIPQNNPNTLQKSTQSANQRESSRPVAQRQKINCQNNTRKRKCSLLNNHLELNQTNKTTAKVTLRVRDKPKPEALESHPSPRLRQSRPKNLLDREQ